VAPQSAGGLKKEWKDRGGKLGLVQREARNWESSELPVQICGTGKGFEAQGWLRGCEGIKAQPNCVQLLAGTCASPRKFCLQAPEDYVLLLALTAKCVMPFFFFPTLSGPV
jgi:hypothetical protein